MVHTCNKATNEDKTKTDRKRKTDEMTKMK